MAVTFTYPPAPPQVAPIGGATEAEQIVQTTLLTDIDAKVTSIDNKTPALVSGSVPVTGTFYQATQPVSGTVAVSNFPATQAVTGTFYQATQPVSGPLTDTQLRATPVPISGTVTANVGTTNGLALDASLTTLNTSVNTLLKPASTLAAVTTVGSITSALPTGTNVIGALTANQSVNNAQVAGVATSTGAGPSNTGTQRISVANVATATLANITSATSSATALAASTSRSGASFYNDSTATCYLKFGATASSTSFTVLLTAGAYYELPTPHIYAGIIDVIWATANGALRVTSW